MQSETANILSVLTAAATAKGIKAKKQVFRDHKDTPNLKEFIQWVLDPGHNFYMRKLPDMDLADDSVGTESDYQPLTELLNTIAYTIRGEAAQRSVRHAYTLGTGSFKALINIALSRQLPGGVGRAIVNSVWPGLVYKQPYGGVASYDADKMLTRFKWGVNQDLHNVLAEEKADGMTLMLVKHMDICEVRTRAGQDVTIQMLAITAPFFNAMEPDTMLHVEANLAEPSGVLMDRAESNGVFNHLFAGDGTIDPTTVVFTGLDLVNSHGYFKGIDRNSTINRLARLRALARTYGKSPQQAVFRVVNHMYVYTPEHARACAQTVIQRGGEGAVIKDGHAPWEAKRMTSQMKLKNEFECTLRVVGWKPHKKDPNLIGSLLVQSDRTGTDEDLVVKSYVGSGLTSDGGDLDRANSYHGYWEGQLIEVKAEAITKKDRLSLPRITGIRNDKDEADSYDEVWGAYNDSIALQE